MNQRLVVGHVDKSNSKTANLMAWAAASFITCLFASAYITCIVLGGAAGSLSTAGRWIGSSATRALPFKSKRPHTLHLKQMTSSLRK